MIIDASIAAKWFLKEEDSAQADALLKKSLPLRAPTLIRTEVSSAIAKAVRFYSLSDTSAKALNDLWHQRLQKGLIKLEADIAVEREGFQDAVAYGHPLPDCLYIALAQQHKLPLLSADVKQSEIAKQCGVEIITLEDI